jgi:hypothetical protein
MLHGHGHGLQFVRSPGGVWLPESLPGLLTLLRTDLDDLVQYATQPNVNNPGFDTDTAWTKGADWSISGGYAQCASGTGTSITQAFLTTGCRYQIDTNIASLSGGTLDVMGGTNVWATASGAGTIASEGTAQSTTFGLRANTGVSVSVDSVSNYKNLSITSLTPCAGTYTSPFSQANATVMPWRKNGIVYADTDVLRAATNPSSFTPLHRNADYYWFMVVKMDSIPIQYGLWSTLPTSPTIGARAMVLAGGSILIRVSSAAGAAYNNNTTPAGTFPVGQYNLVIGRHVSGASPTYSVYCNSSTPASTFSGNAALFDTDTDAQGLELFAYVYGSSSYALVGSSELFGIGIGQISADDLNKLGQYCRDTFGTGWS